MSIPLATLVAQYGDALRFKYAERLLPSHHAALEAIQRCRTAEAGELLIRCSGCGQVQWQAHSCGHRSCPQCQNHEVSRWLGRQREKRLPVDYFLVTFTLPAELRTLAFNHQRAVYEALFAAATQTLKTFGLNPKHLGAELGMTAMLHTHNRRLDFHPHLHVLVPGGGIDRDRRCWKRTRYQYLFNEFALATVFRAKRLHELNQAGMTLPTGVPSEWVVDCRHVGKGASALDYLSRYLYRGVIAETNILTNQDGQVTFRYTDSKTDQTDTRTLRGEDFLWLVIQHVLPRGFHRVRDYGFLHHNAKRWLQFVQLILQVPLPIKTVTERPCFCCHHCGQPMVVIAVRQRRYRFASAQGPPVMVSV